MRFQAGVTTSGHRVVDPSLSQTVCNMKPEERFLFGLMLVAAVAVAMTPLWVQLATPKSYDMLVLYAGTGAFALAENGVFDNSPVDGVDVRWTLLKQPDDGAVPPAALGAATPPSEVRIGRLSGSYAQLLYYAEQIDAMTDDFVLRTAIQKQNGKDYRWGRTPRVRPFLKSATQNNNVAGAGTIAADITQVYWVVDKLGFDETNFDAAFTTAAGVAAAENAPWDDTDLFHTELHGLQSESESAAKVGIVQLYYGRIVTATLLPLTDGAFDHAPYPDTTVMRITGTDVAENIAVDFEWSIIQGEDVDDHLGGSLPAIVDP